MVVQLLPCKLVPDPSPSFPVLETLTHTHHTALVSQCLRTDCHLFATLENSLLDSGLCPVLVSQSLRKQNSALILDSLIRMKHPNPKRRIAFHSSFLIPNLISLPHCLPFSNSRRHGVCLFQLNEIGCRKNREIHDVEQTKKFAPLITRKTTVGPKCPQVGSWCQHNW